VQVAAAGAQLFEQPPRVAEAAHHRNAQRLLADLGAQLLDASFAAQGLDFERPELLARDQGVGRAQRRLHHAAGRAEQLAGARALAEGDVGLLALDGAQVDAVHAQQLSRFARSEDVVHVRR